MSMNLWNWIKEIIYRPAFFVDQAFTLKQGLKFYAGLIALFVMALSLIALPGTVRFVHEVLSEHWDRQVSIISELYPGELVLSVRQGQVSTNMVEPYAIPLPLEWRTSEFAVPENLLVIDTTKRIETDDFNREDTWFIIGADQVGFYNYEKNEYRINDVKQSLGDTSLTIHADEYTQFVTKGAHYLRIVLLVGVALLPFLLYALFFVGYLLYMVVGAILVMITARFRGYTIGYGRAYLSGLYLLSMSLSYLVLLSLFHVQAMPLGFTLLLFVATLLNFPKKLVVPVVPSESGTVPENK